MRPRFLPLFAFVVLAASVPPVRAAEKKVTPTVVVRLNALDDLIADALYLAEAAGKGAEAKELERILKNLGGLKGVDASKPIGLYGRLAKQIEESDLALMVPVTDEKEFLGMLEGVGVKFVKEKEDVYKVELPKVPFAGYFRFANGYAYGTIRDPKLLAKDRLLAPADVLTPGKQGVLEIAFRLEQVPEAYRELIISQVALQLGQAKGDKKENQTDAQYKFHCAILDELAEQIKAVVNDGSDLTLKLDVDRKNADVVATARFSAKPGSKLAASLAEAGQNKSIVANLTGADSALGWRAYAAMPQGLRKSFEAFVDDSAKQARANAPDAAARDLLDQLVKAARPTLQAAELDAGFDLRGPTTNGRYTVVSAAAVKEGADVEKAVRAFHAVIPPDVREAIKLDAHKAGDVNIHRVTIPADRLDANFKKMFGDGPMYFALRKDAVLFAAGDKALEALEEVVAREPRAGKLVQLDLSLARLVPLFEKEDAAAVAKKVFAGKTDADKVRLTLEGGKALELRLSVKAKLLEFGVRLDEARKKGDQ